MRLLLPAALLTASALTIGISGVSAMQNEAQQGDATAVSPYRYADIADLATAAPVVLHARIADSAMVEPERFPGLAAGHSRTYVEADIVSLIRGAGPPAKRVAYLVDLPLGARGKPVTLKKHQPVLPFARPVGAPGSTSTSSIQLVAPDAHLDWDPSTEENGRAHVLTTVTTPHIISRH